MKRKEREHLYKDNKMKRKEREHLKEDPFINFVEKVIEVFKKFKKVIFIGIGVFLAVVLVLVIIIYFKSTSVSNENELYSKAFSIKKSEILSSGEKLTKLRQLKTKKGISSVINLFLLSDKELEISKDFILLKIARIQLKSGKKGSAISNLKNLINDFPQSFYYNEAKALLDEIEAN
jgi:cell division protein FtsL